MGVALDSRGGRTIVAGGDPAGQQLTVFETVSGRLLRTVGLRGRLLLMPEFGPDSTLTLDTMAARAYITTYDQPTSSGPARGYVNVVDTRGGLLLSAVSPRLPNTMVRGTGGFLLARTLPVAVTADEPTGRAFVVNYSDVFARRRGSVTVVDGHSGRILGEVLTGKSPQAVAVDQSTGAAFAVWQRTKPATGEPAEPSHLSMLDGRDGHVVWTITLPYGGQPVVAPSLDRLFLVARSDGDARSTGHLTVINTRRRTVVRTLALDALGSCALLTLDEPRARAYLASGVAMPDAGGDDPARLRVLDARTGALLHTTILRGSPRGMAVDTRRGRIMVLLAHEGHGTRDAPGSLVILPSFSSAPERATTPAPSNRTAGARGLAHAGSRSAGGQSTGKALAATRRARPCHASARSSSTRRRRTAANGASRGSSARRSCPSTKGAPALSSLSRSPCVE